MQINKKKILNGIFLAKKCLNLTKTVDGTKVFPTLGACWPEKYQAPPSQHRANWPSLIWQTGIIEISSRKNVLSGGQETSAQRR